MKYLVMALFLIPLHLSAQELREASAEERKNILTSKEEENLKQFGIEKSKKIERQILNGMLVRSAIEHGKLDENQMKGYIQKLTDQGLEKKSIESEIETLTNLYFAELQYQNLSKVLTPEKQKEYEIKFDQLQGEFEEGKLSQDQLDKEISILDKDISSSPMTLENERKRDEFNKAFANVFENNHFKKEIHPYDKNQFTPIRILVPQNFTLNASKPSDVSHCCSPKPRSTSPQLDKLNDDLKAISVDSKTNKIHKIYFAWGYNRDFHSKTDVKFKTADGTFIVHDAKGSDRPSKWDPKVYLDPTKLSIPQYNVEIGVMFNEKWGMELKQDHMKYIFEKDLPYELSGEYNRKVVIPNENQTNEWDPFVAVDFSVAKAKKDASWLGFEHSDGYNYVSLGAVYNQNLFHTKNKNFSIDSRLGGGAGLMIPKTKVMFHQDQQWNWQGLDNKFHLAGGGIHAEAKLRFTFWNAIFLQASTRGTYIKVADALVNDKGARMEHLQPIASVQYIGQIGYTHTFNGKKKKLIKK